VTSILGLGISGIVSGGAAAVGSGCSVSTSGGRFPVGRLIVLSMIIVKIVRSIIVESHVGSPFGR